MELRDYLKLLWRWAWLLGLGLLAGTLGGLAFAWYQPPEYEAATTIMIMRPAEADLSELARLSDQQLAQTYGQLLLTRPVLEAAEAQLGYALDTTRISLRFVPDTQLIRVAVRDRDPGRAANGANALIEAFVVQSEALQGGRYAEAEARLQQQIAQVEQQIADVQSQIASTAQTNLALQRALVAEHIAAVEQQMAQLQSDLVRLESAFELSATPLLLTPPPARPTPALDDRIELELLRSRLSQLQELLGLYQAAQVSLNVQGNTLGPNQASVTGGLQSALTLYGQIHAGLLNDYAQLRLARLRAAPVVTQVEPAVAPQKSLALNPRVAALMGTLVGLALAATIIFLREYLDDTLRTTAQLAEGYELPVLSSIPTLSRRARQAPLELSRNSAAGVEAFRTLRANLDFSQAFGSWATLLVTSRSPGEGKSTVSSNLAMAWAKAHRRVLLIDADLRSPHQHMLLHLPNSPGLTDVLTGVRTLDEALQAGPHDGLLVLASGDLPANPAELLGSPQMFALMQAARERADLVVVDGPPLELADGLLLASRVDAVLLAALPGRTALAAARAIHAQLARTGARLLGLVVNRAADLNQPGYYAAQGGPGVGAERADGRAQPRRRAPVNWPTAAARREAVAANLPLEADYDLGYACESDAADHY